MVPAAEGGDETCGCSSMVEPQPSKLVVWVRFPSPAPLDFKTLVDLDTGDLDTGSRVNAAVAQG